MNPEMDERETSPPLEWPESAPWWSQWTYWYMLPILLKGSDDSVELGSDDLYRIPESMECRRLMKEFDEFFRMYPDEKEIFKAVWKLTGEKYFIPAGLCEIFRIIALSVNPLLIRELLKTIEDHPGSSIRTEIRQAYIPAICSFLLLLVMAFTKHRHDDYATRGGIVIRAALASNIYRHALLLSPEGMADLNTGEVTNLIATDTQKLFEVAQQIHLTWSCPFAICIVTCILLWVLGPVSLVGVFFLVLFTPVIDEVTRRMISARRKRVTITDERLNITSAMLQGMKVTKLNNYEKGFQRRIVDTRELEMKYVRKELVLWGMTLVITVMSPIFATAFTFIVYTLIDENNILDASTAFSVLLLFSALRFPINQFGKMLGKAAQAYESSRRIGLFLQRSVRNVIDVCKRSDEGNSVTIKNGNFVVGSINSIPCFVNKQCINEQSKSGFLLQNINFNLKPRDMLAVVGPVASGKSTLMKALIGDVATSANTDMTLNGTIAYASQNPFIMNTSLRENILFGKPFDRLLYNRVLDACCLRPDLKQIGPAEDLTQIGERGVTLSGGQKQRVSLARVAYFQPDIAIFDDPLSALDAETSRLIFDRLFRAGNNGPLSSSTIILVTHAAYLLESFDQILALVDGQSMFCGSWKELVSLHSEDVKGGNFLKHLQSSVQEGGNESDDGDSVPPYSMMSTYNDEKLSRHDKSETKIMVEEDRNFGLSNLKTWVIWFREAGGWPFTLIQVIFMTFDRASYIFTEWWLAVWTKAAHEDESIFTYRFRPQSTGRDAQFAFVRVYIALILLSTFFCALRSQWVVLGGARCSESLYYQMLNRVLYAPMSYFETTPLGRVLNRFTYDIETLDVTLAQAMSITLIATSWFIAGISVMITILPWILIILLPVIASYFYLQYFYRKSSVDLQRIDAISRSPIQALLAEGLDGAQTIRVFKQENAFMSQFNSRIDDNASAMLNFLAARRWLGIILEALGGLISLVASLLIITKNESFQIQPGIAAMLIIWSTNFTITLSFLIDAINDSEAAITAVERINAMTKLPQEKSMVTSLSRKLNNDWPTNGIIEFKDVCLRYRDGLPLALDNLSFKVNSGIRIGIVGRTGAGKSSVTAALFRLVELESGHIFLDGVDLSTLGLTDVRGRTKGMSIIPQDPILFAGTLRECIDPAGKANDEEIFEALRCVRIAQETDSVDQILMTAVEEGGANFSVGERQLLCLARSIISKPRLLILDEATASVDAETDVFIQKMLRERFKGTTLLTIAHRLNTIIDYDKVLVMNQGKAVEFGSPLTLLENDTLFSELVDATGIENSKKLRKMAKESYKF